MSTWTKTAPTAEEVRARAKAGLPCVVWTRWSEDATPSAHHVRAGGGAVWINDARAAEWERDGYEFAWPVLTPAEIADALRAERVRCIVAAIRKVWPGTSDEEAREAIAHAIAGVNPGGSFAPALAAAILRGDQ